jgi:hypothetical protein
MMLHGMREMIEIKNVTLDQSYVGSYPQFSQCFGVNAREVVIHGDWLTAELSNESSTNESSPTRHEDLFSHELP